MPSTVTRERNQAVKGMTTALLKMETEQYSALPASEVHRMTWLSTWPGVTHAAELRLGKLPEAFVRPEPDTMEGLNRLGELISSHWRAAIIAALIDNGPTDDDGIAEKLRTMKQTLNYHINHLREGGLLRLDRDGRNHVAPELSNMTGEFTVYQHQHGSSMAAAMRNTLPFLDFATTAWAVLDGLDSPEEAEIPSSAPGLAAQGVGLLHINSDRTTRVLVEARRAAKPKSTSSYLNALGRGLSGIVKQAGEGRTGPESHPEWQNMQHVR